MGRGARSQRGFTLLEVLVALAVMGISLLVLMRLVSGTLRLERTAHDHSRALAVAQAKIDALSLEEVPGNQAGEADGVGWSITAYPVWGATDQTQLYRVLVAVERPGGRLIRFETLRVATRR